MTDTAPGSADLVHLPTHQQLLLEKGLYESFELRRDHRYVRLLEESGDVWFDAYCIHCGLDATFKKPGSALTNPNTRQIDQALSNRRFSVTFYCGRVFAHSYYYVFEIKDGSISKVGQSPSIADIASVQTKRFRGVLAKEYLSDLNRAVGLHAHGIGAGAFVYLRRIFEHLLFKSAADVRASGVPLEDFESLPIDKKVKALRDHLPKEVVDAADIYSILSAGIHALSENECRELFPVMHESIVFILDGYLAAKQKEMHKRSLLAAIQQAKGQVRSSLPGGE